MFRYAIAKWQSIINPDAGARDQEQQESTGMIRREITIINKLGLHARAAAKLVSTASAYSCQVKVGYKDRMVDGKSIMAVMMLAASKGTDIELHADGSDAEDAINALTDLINRRFDEEE